MSKFEVGDIIKIFNREVVPPHLKFSVCVAVKPDLFLLINTENRKMYQCLPISEKGYVFLDHDSHIACNRAFSYKLYELGKCEVLGRLALDDIKRLHSHIKDNVSSLPGPIKNHILESLKKEILDNI